MSDQPESAPNPPSFNPNAPHQCRPKLRPVRGFPAQAQGPDGKTVQVLGLADARQISDKVVFMAPAVQLVLPKMDGTRDLEQIAVEIGRGLTRQMLEPIVAQLDDAGLLEGPVFEALDAKMRREFDDAENLPPGSTAAFADMLVTQKLGREPTEDEKASMGADLMRETFDQWIDHALKDVANPSFNELPKAVVAPHIDYARGWLNYASVWGRLRVTDRPDRVIVLGTNHFGSGTGVVACDKGYQTPLGVCPVDSDLVGLLRGKLGNSLFENRYDHEREHSIELQIPWIQHCLGKDDTGAYCKVFGALVHDPTVNNGESYDGRGVGLVPFIETLRESLRGLPGGTLVVSSADLSHVGPAFGDEKPLAGEAEDVVQRRNQVVGHDREMLELVRQNRPDELVAAMSWQQNPTRWCSIGNIVAALKVVEPQGIEILNYVAALDQQGMGMVCSVAMVAA